MTAATPSALPAVCCQFCGLQAASALEVGDHVWEEHMVDVREVRATLRLVHAATVAPPEGETT